MVDLHTHDTFSRYDGYGRPIELARIAKRLGHTSLSTSNHGNTNGLILTYKACKEVGLKAILGTEGYFLPVYKEQEKGYHLCLFVKNLEGYKNLNTLQYEGEKQKYYNPIWDFNLLEKYHEGLICTSACVGSYSAQCIIKGNINQAVKYLKKMVSIFGEDFYIEIQPYVVTEKGIQEKVNVELIKIAEKLKIKCILTSDSHRGLEEEMETYLKMHQMDGHNMNHIEGTYEERYKPELGEMERRFVLMHYKDFGRMKSREMARDMVDNLEEIESKVEENILDGLKLELPQLEGDTQKLIVSEVTKGLKERGKYTKKYIDRCKEELHVIKTNGYVDYFLIVADYVKWAKNRGICVGQGRGSVCNCLVAYALRITEVDSILYNLDFRRFMRLDKKKMPDIDLDFETDRRQEVIDYLIDKYKGHSARVSSYGLYKVDNTINDLAKVCGLPIDKTVDEMERKENKEVIARIKKIATRYKLENGSIDSENLLCDKEAIWHNKKYDNILLHFVKLFDKVKYIGTHAAGVVITSGDILQYTALRIDKDGKLYSVYDLGDLNDVNIIKFDILGLKTLQSLGECRKLSGVNEFIEDCVNDDELLNQFKIRNTNGIFQSDKEAPKNIFENIGCDCFEDVIATCAMNRPGSLKQGSPYLYAENKKNGIEQSDILLPYVKESYGAIIYQEQSMLICVEIGGLSWNEADMLVKTNNVEESLQKIEEYKRKTGIDLREKFIKNAIKNGLDRKEAVMIFEALLGYSFNKGHATGYSMITMEEMYYKYYYPTIFWYVKIKYANDDKEKERYCCEASKSVVVWLPHINYSVAGTSIRKVEGEDTIQKGLTDIKGIGEKAAEYIVKERKAYGVFISRDNFIDRCRSQSVNVGTIKTLDEQGALEFDKEKYIRKVITYNSTLQARCKN